MEKELGIPSSLMAQPKTDMVSLGKAQLGFMNLFAIPLFRGVADIIPAMKYCVDELDANKALFESLVAEEQEKRQSTDEMAQSDDVHPSATTAVDGNPESVASQTTKVLAPAPAFLQTRSTTEQEFMPHPAHPIDKPPRVPVLNGEYKEVNGIVTSFDAVADFAASDPFHVNGNKHGSAAKQRCSETTEGSSVPYSAEWASGATSATTGKMPLSPSTQGTSIVSRDSMDRPVSVPVTTITAAESTTTAPESAKSQPDIRIESHVFDEPMINGRDGKLKALEVELDSCKTLKKKPSRFRINALPFFRRHKGSSSPMSATESAG
jgi:hypothetical protein